MTRLIMRFIGAGVQIIIIFIVFNISGVKTMNAIKNS